MTKPRIAFLGTGLMGGPMAANLLKAGFPVTAWNRTLSKAEALRSAGATVAQSAPAAASGADVVITMLEGGPVVEAVLFEGGVA
ncbi:MAG TPA: NAD(P)-binding domain-containing protein, partial [Stellaceae bacterium]|nr:NAD(P)-binding domain-containing protein [Stellaceae bacterium]